MKPMLFVGGLRVIRSFTGWVVLPLIFPKVPQSSLGILRIPHLPPSTIEISSPRSQGTKALWPPGMASNWPNALSAFRVISRIREGFATMPKIGEAKVGPMGYIYITCRYGPLPSNSDHQYYYIFSRESL